MNSIKQTEPVNESKDRMEEEVLEVVELDVEESAPRKTSSSSEDISSEDRSIDEDSSGVDETHQDLEKYMSRKKDSKYVDLYHYLTRNNEESEIPEQWDQATYNGPPIILANDSKNKIDVGSECGCDVIWKRKIVCFYPREGPSPILFFNGQYLPERTWVDAVYDPEYKVLKSEFFASREEKPKPKKRGRQSSKEVGSKQEKSKPVKKKSKQDEKPKEELESVYKIGDEYLPQDIIVIAGKTPKVDSKLRIEASKVAIEILEINKSLSKEPWKLIWCSNSKKNPVIPFVPGCDPKEKKIILDNLSKGRFNPQFAQTLNQYCGSIEIKYLYLEKKELKKGEAQMLPCLKCTVTRKLNDSEVVNEFSGTDINPLKEALKFLFAIDNQKIPNIGRKQLLTQLVRLKIRENTRNVSQVFSSTIQSLMPPYWFENRKTFIFIDDKLKQELLAKEEAEKIQEEQLKKKKEEEEKDNSSSSSDESSSDDCSSSSS